MKNKKVVYFLLFVVLLIWGIIFYRIFSTVGGADDSGSYTGTMNDNSMDKNVPDTFNINGNYRDPFLGTMQADKPVVHYSAPKTPVVKEEKMIQPLAWPAIVYGGMIKNKQSNKQLVLVQINGQNNLMMVGNTVDGVQLLKIYRDSLEVSFQKAKKWIKK